VGPTAASKGDTKQLHQPDDYRTQFHILLDDYVEHGHRLRALHEHYVGLVHTGLSNEQRREAFLGILNSEMEVLAEARLIKQTLDALKEERLLHLRSGT
jgi:hypothetical protein